jgi:chromosome segregation ATPase
MPNDRPREQLLDLPEGDPHSTEHLDEQVQKAQDELAQLRKRQELIERQKRELEEMSKRQDQFTAGRSEVVEKLTRAVVVLEREKYEAQRRVETLETIDESFRTHLALLDGIDPKDWEGLDLNKELTRAQGAVDDARMEYSKNNPKIASEPSPEQMAAQSDSYASEGGGGRDFKEWLVMGFAFTLPLIVCVLILIVILATK